MTLTEHTPAPTVEIGSIPEWSERVGCSADAAYRAARCGQIPGLFRIGRLMRINRTAFVAATTVR
jgi:hypothetical protein